MTTAVIALFLATNLPERMHLNPHTGRGMDAMGVPATLVERQGWPIPFRETQSWVQSANDRTLYTAGTIKIMAYPGGV